MVSDIRRTNEKGVARHRCNVIIVDSGNAEMRCRCTAVTEMGDFETSVQMSKTDRYKTENATSDMVPSLIRVGKRQLCIHRWDILGAEILPRMNHYEHHHRLYDHRAVKNVE